VGGWGLLVLVSAWLESRTGLEVPTCLLKRVTGHPCPTCGSTRAILALGRGRWVEALAWNPLVMLGLGTLLLMVAHQALAGRRMVLEADDSGRRLVWGVAALAFLLNWLWVWPRA
jgi:hypothetical protein